MLLELQKMYSKKSSQQNGIGYDNHPFMYAGFINKSLNKSLNNFCGKLWHQVDSYFGDHCRLDRLICHLVDDRTQISIGHNSLHIE